MIIAVSEGCIFELLNNIDGTDKGQRQTTDK